MRRTIIPPQLRSVYTQWHFAPAVVSNGLIFCSGIVGTSIDGEAPGASGLAGAEAILSGNSEADIAALVAVGDPEAQFATAFEALSAVLAEAGATLSDVVELTSYHVDMARHMGTFMTVRDRYLSEPWPAWTAIGVSELAVPGGLVELRAIASAPEG